MTRDSFEVWSRQSLESHGFEPCPLSESLACVNCHDPIRATWRPTWLPVDWSVKSPSDYEEFSVPVSDGELHVVTTMVRRYGSRVVRRWFCFEVWFPFGEPVLMWCDSYWSDSFVDVLWRCREYGV